MVNYIRRNPEFFSKWHQSVIALRFAVQRTREAVCAAGVPQCKEGFGLLLLEVSVQSAVGEATSQGSFVGHIALELRHEALIFLQKVRPGARYVKDRQVVCHSRMSERQSRLLILPKRSQSLTRPLSMPCLLFVRKIKSASAHNSKSIRYDTTRQTPRTKRLR